MAINPTNQEFIIRLLADFTADTLAELDADLATYVDQYVHVLENDKIYRIENIGGTPTRCEAADYNSYVTSPNDMATETTQQQILQTLVDDISKELTLQEVRDAILNFDISTLGTESTLVDILTAIQNQSGGGSADVHVEDNFVTTGETPVLTPVDKVTIQGEADYTITLPPADSVREESATLIAVAHSTGIEFYDATTYDIIPHNRPELDNAFVFCVKFSPSANLVAVGLGDSSLYLYDTTSGFTPVAFDDSMFDARINDIKFTADGSHMIVATHSLNQSLFIFETTTWTQVHSEVTDDFNGTGRVYGCDASINGNLLATAQNVANGVRVYDISGATWVLHSAQVLDNQSAGSVAFSNSGQYLAVGGDGGATSNYKVFDMSNSNILLNEGVEGQGTTPEHVFSYAQVWNADDSLVIFGRFDGGGSPRFNVYETNTWTEVFSGSSGSTFSPNQVRGALILSADESILFAGGDEIAPDNCVGAFNVSDWTQNATITAEFNDALTQVFDMDIDRAIVEGSQLTGPSTKYLDLETGTGTTSFSEATSNSVVLEDATRPQYIYIPFRLGGGNHSALTDEIGIKGSVDHVFFGRKNNDFYVSINRDGSVVEKFFGLGEFNGDALDGSAGSMFKDASGQPVAFDYQKNQLFRINIHSNGSGIVSIEALSPSGESWVLVHVFGTVNVDETPAFVDDEFNAFAKISKVGGNGVNYTARVGRIVAGEYQPLSTNGSADVTNALIQDLIDEANESQTIMGNLATSAKQDEIKDAIDAGVTVNQGSAGANPWPVDIGGATVSVSNLQQLSNNVDINEVADLQAGSYTKTVSYANDATVKLLRLTFDTAEERTVTIKTLYAGEENVIDVETITTVGTADYEFESEGEVVTGTDFIIEITQTTGPCSVKVLLISQIGTSALGGNPILGESNAFIGNIGFGDSTALDAFGRLRVSQPENLLSVKQIYANTNLFYQGFGAGEIEQAPNKAGVILRIPAGQTGVQTYASHRHISYQPGKSLFQQITAVWGETTPGIIRRAGMRNIYGERIYVEQNGNDDEAYTVVESMAGKVFGVDQPERRAIPRDLWLDRLDGTGGDNNKSGIEIDPTKNHLVNIDFQWLSAGRVRFSYSFAGQPTLVSVHQHGNVIDLPFTRCPDMQIFWEIEVTDNTLAVDSEFLAICSAMSSEGGKEPTGISYGVTTNGQVITVGNTGYEPVLAIRSAATYKGDPNVVVARLKSFGLYSDDDISYRLVWFPDTVTGGTWVPRGGNSSIEYNVNPTSITGGQILDEDFIDATDTGSKKQGQSIEDVLSQQEVVCRTADNQGSLMMVLLAKSEAGTSTVKASMKWVEDIG